MSAVEILEGFHIFPQTIDYWPPAPTTSPPFPIIGLNLHPKLIIGWQGSYGLMCGLNEAIENLPSSLLLPCIILREGKYYQMELFTHDGIALAATIQMNLFIVFYYLHWQPYTYVPLGKDSASLCHFKI